MASTSRNRNPPNFVPRSPAVLDSAGKDTSNNPRRVPGNASGGSGITSLRNQAVAAAHQGTLGGSALSTVAGGISSQSVSQQSKSSALVLVPDPAPSTSGDTGRALIQRNGSNEEPLPAADAIEAGSRLVIKDAADPRQTFSKFVESVLDDVDKYQSPTVLCEMLMQRAYKTPDSTPALRAAAGAWALDLLAENQPVLAPIREALLPTMFVDYSSQNLLSGASATDRMRFSGDILKSNPYLSHRFFFENHHEVQRKIGQLVAMNDKHESMISFRTDKTKALLSTMRGDQKRNVFFAWRAFARRSVIERFSRRIFERHGRREAKHVTMEACFYRWRWAVEQGRTAFLEERANTLVYQVDNAKNQFQLQCFRSDKYLRTVEELRDEVSSLRDDRNKLREEVKKLERGLQEFEKDSQSLLNDSVNEVLQVLSQWRVFARTLVDERVTRTQKVTMEEPQDDWEDEEEEEDEDLEMESTLEASASLAPPTGGGGLMGQSGRRRSSIRLKGALPPDFTPEQALLRWCSTICSNSVVAKISHVKNFTTDFQSGEVLVLCLHHVYPHRVPLSALQEGNLAKRYDMITELAAQVGISYLIKPNDIREGTGDIMLLTVAELFLRYIAKQRTEKSSATQDKAERSSNMPTIRYDAEMMTHVIQEAKKEMSKLKGEELGIESQEATLAAVEEAVAKHASHFARERIKGVPVEILDPKELGRYTRFNKARFQDIAFKYQKPPAEYPVDKWLTFDLQLTQLKKELRRQFHEMRKVFKYYAGTGGTMTDTDFWRLCADIRVIDRHFSRHLIDRIFTIANSDDIPQKVEINPDDLDPDADPNAIMMQQAMEAMADDGDEEENPTTELIPGEFVECLIRMADAKFTGKMIHERFTLFMTNHIEAYACKSESDKFKKEIFLPSTQLALQRYHKDLSKVFQHYGTGRGSKRTMNSESFSVFCKESNLHLDEPTQNSLMVNMLGVGAEEFAQHDFMEIFACIAAIRTPTPFLGLDRKVDILASNVIATLRVKLKGHGVTLSDIKPISMNPPSSSK